MKSNQQVQPIVADDFASVTFAIADGKEPLVLDMTKLHPDIRKRAAAIGMAQVRIVDAAAIPATDKDGNIIPAAQRLAMKRERMAALIEYYHTGTAEWSRVSEGGGGGKSLTVEAIARVKDISYDEAEAEVVAFAERKFEGDTKKALAFLRQGSRVAEAMEAIRKERMPQPKVDADAALAELGG